jgi:nicotinate-nucleotide adenylyltransferase|tara:strand:- start:358 stop:942 length:585 start_codon:yes stop_codon:yes gene_type:complete
VTTKREIGLFFGSFNPIHIGHLILANYMIEYSDMDEVWFVVSPQNPFKNSNSLLPDIHRYAIVDRAIEDEYKFKVSNIEFNMSKPSYTIDTLVNLHEKYPDISFSLIMGADNLTHLHKWKNVDVMLEDHKVYVYPRPNSKPGKLDNHPSINLMNAPKIDISASFIRSAIKDNKDISWFLPKKAWIYITEMGFYK